MPAGRAQLLLRIWAGVGGARYLGETGSALYRGTETRLGAVRAEPFGGFEDRTKANGRHRPRLQTRPETLATLRGHPRRH